MKTFGDLVKDLQNIEANMEQAKDHLLKSVGSELLEEVKDRTPVDNGDLKDAWHLEFDKDAMWLFNKQDYAGYVEFGHRTRGGNNYVPGVFMLRDAKDTVRNNMDSHIDMFWGMVLPTSRG